MRLIYNYIEKIVVFLFIVFGLSKSHSQNKQILYNWEATHQSLMLNPGDVVRFDSHYGIPFLSHFHINGGSSGVTISDIFLSDGIPINTKLEKIISELNSRDFFTATQQAELFNVGKRTESGTYISYGIYQELDAIVYFPKDLILLAREGNRDYINYPFNFNNISFRGDLTTVFHFGFNKKITHKLTAGIRYKFYSSMLNFTSTRNTGTLTTTRTSDTPNVYRHSISNLDVAIKTSGYRKTREIEDNRAANRNLVARSLLGGNYGLGFDVGGTYQFNEDFKVTASVLDVGAIFHLKNTEITRARGEYVFEGAEFLFPNVENGDLGFDNAESLQDEFEREIPIDSLRSGYVQLRPTKINAGFHYDFGGRSGSKNDCDCLVRTKSNPRRSQLGAQYFAVFRPKGLQMAGTIYYRRNFDAGLSLKTTYTVDSFSATNVGVGLALDLGSLNIYIAGDNLLNIINIAKANSLSLQLGFNVIVD